MIKEVISGRRIEVIGLMCLAALLSTAGLPGWLQGSAEQQKPADEQPDAAFNLTHYTQVLRHVDKKSGLVDYRRIQEKPDDLLTFVKQVAEVTSEQYESWSQSEQLAFWCNVYNGLTLQAIVEHYPITKKPKITQDAPANSIRQIPGVWKGHKWRVMGREMTLDEIEHKVIRPRFEKPEIHMALVCAAMSCPPLRHEPFTGEKLQAQFDDQTRRFLADALRFKIDRAGKTVYLSAIFQWFGEDFVKGFVPKQGFGSHSEAERASLHFISQYLSESDAAYLRKGKYRIAYLPYDWSLNEKPAK